ncbi:hypothetical protein NOC27_911 [Nitrosococcus oceani AFC27]|nr:hypothetical protein NOC27_911 [Nitrosococcus oceani AFC27]
MNVRKAGKAGEAGLAVNHYDNPSKNNCTPVQLAQKNQSLCPLKNFGDCPRFQDSAMISNSPLQFGPCSMPVSNTRFNRRAQRMPQNVAPPHSHRLGCFCIPPKLFGVTQPCVSDLMRGKIELFSLASLANMATVAGLHVELHGHEPETAP